MQSGRFIHPEYYNKFPRFKIINSVANSFEKELNNAGPKVLNCNHLVDALLLVKKNFHQLQVQE